jgi:hypothetical protein
MIIYKSVFACGVGKHRRDLPSWSEICRGQGFSIEVSHRGRCLLKIALQEERRQIDYILVHPVCLSRWTCWFNVEMPNEAMRSSMQDELKVVVFDIQSVI